MVNFSHLHSYTLIWCILFNLVSAPYGDCDQLLNAGIRKTGVHIISDKNWLLPFYCDQDYMGGGNALQ